MEERKEYIPVPKSERARRSAVSHERQRNIKHRPIDGVPEVPFDPCGSDFAYTEDELAFIQAMERYQRLRKRRFPTYREILAVLVAMGYRKVAAESTHGRTVDEIIIEHSGHSGHGDNPPEEEVGDNASHS